MMRAAALLFALSFSGISAIGCSDPPKGSGPAGSGRANAPAPTSTDPGAPPALPGERDPFADRSEEQVEADIAEAQKRAEAEGKQVLLEFVAPWCRDCREVVRVARLEPAANVLREGYVVVPVNVGRFNRNVKLLRKYGITLVAALVVLSPDGTFVGKTTLEPMTKHRPLSPEALADWLRNPQGT